MLDTFSKDIIYKELPPPYTQTLFIELIRFSPGQPDTVLTNGPSTHPSSSSSHPPHPPVPNGHSYHPRNLPPPPPRAPILPYSPPHPMNAPVAHMPPPPPWEVKWTRPVPAPTSAPAPPPPVSAASTITASSSSARRLSVSSVATPIVNDDKRLPAVDPLTPPSASRKRKYPEGDAASERASPYGSPSYKRHTPGADPLPPKAPTSSSSSSSSSSAPAPAPVPPGHRATQTLSPSLAMIMSPDTRHVPYVGTSSAPLPATPPQQQRKVKLTYTNGEGTPR
jgi:[histone H3]-trimethyl-L-lysine4 demethylase